MSKKGIFYGSSSGNTQNVAGLIAAGLGIAESDVFDVATATSEKLLGYDVLLLGSSTLGYGDLQDDWETFIGKLEKTDLSGKKVAVFGTGDSSAYSDTFCDSIGLIAEAAEKAGATLVGAGIDASGYSFDDSKALKDGAFCGLPIDEDNEPAKTRERVEGWIERLKAEID
ncbi:MAG: flavodoxin [Prevotellaceae bacterium]|jgi:flavodoxin I|nr:flavodoxin [Prevotellaceae bacterium]